jgi:hypothetical protein
MRQSVNSAAGTSRIRLALRGVSECPRHRRALVEGLCSTCVDQGRASGKLLRDRIESTALLGGKIDAAVANHRASRESFDDFIGLNGLDAIAPPPPAEVVGLLDLGKTIPAVLLANRELAQLVADARVGQKALELAIDELRYVGRPLELKIHEAFAASDVAAEFLETWDGITFDATHERELEAAAQRMIVNDRDALVMLDTLRHRNIEPVRAAAKCRDGRSAALMARLFRVRSMG